MTFILDGSARFETGEAKMHLLEYEVPKIKVTLNIGIARKELEQLIFEMVTIHWT